MNTSFAKVSPEDFTKITVERLPHQEIETFLIAIGGGGVSGMRFKNETIKRAGWKGDRLTSFAKNPEKAALAFNNVRKALKKTEDPELLWQMFEK